VFSWNCFKGNVLLTHARVRSVDYILFLTADVDVTPNTNEIRDYKYVDKAELQNMFDDQGTE
jgi:isopentenyldiphosphate isomerase